MEQRATKDEAGLDQECGVEQKQRELARTWIRLPERGGRDARRHDRRQQARRRIHVQPEIGGHVRTSRDAEHGVAANGVLVVMMIRRVIVARMWTGVCGCGAERQLTDVTEQGEKNEDQNEAPGSVRGHGITVTPLGCVGRTYWATTR